MARTGEIYKIVNTHNPSTILYIGSTTQELNTRFKKHVSHSKKHQNTPFYNELYKNPKLYEIQHLCNVYYNEKSELLAREASKIRKYKPLTNIIKDYKNLEDTAETDTDSDTESYLYCRENSDSSIWNSGDERLTQEQKDSKYYRWCCDCNGDCCDCKSSNMYYEPWHLEYPEMYKHKFTDIQYIYENKELRRCDNINNFTKIGKLKI